MKRNTTSHSFLSIYSRFKKCSWRRSSSSKSRPPKVVVWSAKASHLPNLYFPSLFHITFCNTTALISNLDLLFDITMPNHSISYPISVACLCYFLFLQYILFSNCVLIETNFARMERRHFRCSRCVLLSFFHCK